jgi:hypothetical protein
MARFRLRPVRPLAFSRVRPRFRGLGRFSSRLFGRGLSFAPRRTSGGGADFWVEVDDEEVLRELRRLQLGLSDLRSFWPKVVPLATGWWREQFETEGAFGGEPWKPLAFSTVARKQRLGLRPQTLQATGKLKQAASRPSRHATPRSLTLTVDSEYLPFLQEGTSRMPARPLIFERLPLQAELELQEAAEDYVQGLIGRDIAGRF